MKNKILIFSILGVSLIGTVSGYLLLDKESPKEIAQNYELKTYITEEISNNTMNSKVGAMVAYSTTPDSLDKIADNIAIVKIISLDGASMEYDGFVGMSYGTMLINNVIRGGLNVGDVVGYIKPGGTISMKEWETYQPEAANQKRATLREQSGNNVNLENAYINTLVENDINIEVGKTYFVYLKYNGALAKYEIIGLGNGLREVNISKATKSVSRSNININDTKIKNNDTGEYESLNDYISKNIKEAK